MNATVIIDTETCIGCESCVELCPDVFDFDADTEKAFVIQSEDDPRECIEEAIDTCPVECIYWE